MSLYAVLLLRDGRSGVLSGEGGVMGLRDLVLVDDRGGCGGWSSG